MLNHQIFSSKIVDFLIIQNTNNGLPKRIQCGFCFVLTHSAQNDKALVILIKLSYWAFARKRSIHKFKANVLNVCCGLRLATRWVAHFTHSKWQGCAVIAIANKLVAIQKTLNFKAFIMKSTKFFKIFLNTWKKFSLKRL